MKKNYEYPNLSVLHFDIQEALTADENGRYDLPANMSILDEIEEW